MAEHNSETNVNTSPSRNKKITLIVLVSVLVVAIIATAIALIVKADFSPSVKQVGAYTLSISKGKATVTKYSGTDKELEIPDKIDGKRVVGIGAGAFKDNKTLNTVIIKSTAADFSLASEAFYNVSNLNEITLPDGLKAIPDHAFSGCTSLTTVTMGNNVASIGSYAFSECTRLQKVYISESSGGNGRKNGVYDITLPASLESIDSYAFYKAITSTSASVQCSESLKAIGNNAFDGATWITSFDYVGDACALESIGDSAFYGCSRLRFSTRSVPSNPAVTLGAASNVLLRALEKETLTSIGAKAYKDCNYTSSKITLKIKESLESIGEYAFQNCVAIQNIEFLDSKPTLGAGAFYNCSSLKKVSYKSSISSDTEQYEDSKETSLHPDITSIPSLLFYGCDELDGFIIGTQIKTIGNGAFAGCRKSSAVTIYGAEEDANGNKIGENFALYNPGKYYKLSGTSYTEYSHYFLTNTDLDNITVYAYIGDFDEDCYTVRGNDKTLGKFSYVDGRVKTIADYAFGNAKFRSIIIKDSVTTLGANVFNGCKVKNFLIYFLSSSSDYYNTMLAGNMSAEFMSGIEENVELCIMVPQSTSADILESLRTYFGDKVEIAYWGVNPY